MYLVKDSIHINAPIERCFVLSTSVALIGQTVGLPVVSSSKGGNLLKGDRISWRGWAFGLPQHHKTIITAYDKPVFFQNTMEQGPFRRFQHDHHFAEVDGHTLLYDKVHFSLPLGWLGKKVARRLIVPLITRSLRRRFTLLKQVAESDNWRNYVPGGTL